jgi:hypothetical protein
VPSATSSRSSRMIASCTCAHACPCLSAPAAQEIKPHAKSPAPSACVKTSQ